MMTYVCSMMYVCVQLSRIGEASTWQACFIHLQIHHSLKDTKKIVTLAHQEVKVIQSVGLSVAVGNVISPLTWRKVAHLHLP